MITVGWHGECRPKARVKACILLSTRCGHLWRSCVNRPVDHREDVAVDARTFQPKTMRQTRFNEVLETAVRQSLEYIQIVTESDSECTHEIFRVQLLSLVDYALDSFSDAFEFCIGFFASQDILQICALDKMAVKLSQTKSN